MILNASEKIITRDNKAFLK